MLFFSCNLLRSTKKSKIGNHSSHFSKWQASNKKTITHTKLLHSSFNERAKLEQFFPLFQMARNPKKKQSHANTQNFKSLFLLFQITINKKTHTIKRCSFHFSKSQKQKEHMCTHLKTLHNTQLHITTNVKVIELHEDTHKPKNNLKQISSPSQHSTPNWNKFQSSSKPQNKFQAHHNEKKLASNCNKF